jgi:DNA-binding MarR family transcriptional regulator
VLRVLQDAGPLEPTVLAEAALLYGSSVTRIVKELAQRNLICRTTRPDDRRRALVALSENGEELVRVTSSETIARLEDYRARYGAERMERLIDELRDLIAAIAPGAAPRGDAAAAPPKARRRRT